MAHLEIGRPLVPVARLVGQREVVLSVQAVLSQRVEVVHVELPLVEQQVDGFVTDEATTGLPGQ